MSAEVTLFSPLRVGPYELANRIVMAPMTRNRAGAGNVPTELMAQYYAQRAGAGLIVSEATQVSPQGVGYPNTPGIHAAEQVRRMQPGQAAFAPPDRATHCFDDHDLIHGSSL